MTCILLHRRPELSIGCLLLLLLIFFIDISMKRYGRNVRFLLLLSLSEWCKRSLRPSIDHIRFNLPLRFLLLSFSHRRFVLLWRTLLFLLWCRAEAGSSALRHIIIVIIRRTSITGTQEFLVVTLLIWRSLRDFPFNSL